MVENAPLRPTGVVLKVVDLDLKPAVTQCRGNFVAGELASLKANSPALVLTNMTDLNGKLGVAPGILFEPGDYIIEFVAVVVVKNDAPSSFFARFLLLGGAQFR